MLPVTGYSDCFVPQRLVVKKPAVQTGRWLALPNGNQLCYHGLGRNSDGPRFESLQLLTYPDNLHSQFVVVRIGPLVEAELLGLGPVDAATRQVLLRQRQPKLQSSKKFGRFRSKGKNFFVTELSNLVDDLSTL